MDRHPFGRILAGLVSLSMVAGIPVAVGTLMVGTAAPAVGQVLPVSAWHAVVTEDGAFLRCGHGDLMYPVAALKAGQVLRVDGEGQGWARVSYPSDVPAFVPADTVRVDLDTQVATLTRASRLKAFNKNTGLRGSWKDVFDQPLPVGTKLRILDTEPTPDGRGNTAWRIVPPENARAFIRLSDLRRATDEEVKAFTEAQASQPAARVVEREPQPPTERPAVRVAGATDEPSAASPERKPEQKEVEEVSRPAPEPVVLPPSPFEQLEAAFETVRSADPDDAEFAELRAEFERAIAELDDSPASQSVRARLQQRAEFLRLRAELQEHRRAFEEARATFSEEDKRLAERLAEVDRTRQYTIVGRLSASAIYDGERLPLMYRIQTVGGPSPRTLAYVKPDEAMNVKSRLGQIVGVLGEASMDPALRLNVIRPERIDALEATATAVAPSEP